VIPEQSMLDSALKNDARGSPELNIPASATSGVMLTITGVALE
jgi:hypothetical protein